MSEDKRDKKLCGYKECGHYDEIYVGNCRRIPPDECLIKELLDKNKKAMAFVKHIEGHLKTMDVGDQVICKICGKTINEIYKETL
jgi:hypothetical protein